MRKQWREADKLGRALIVAKWFIAVLLLTVIVTTRGKEVSWMRVSDSAQMGLLFLVMAVEEWREHRRVTAVISLCVAVLDFVVVVLTWPN